MHHCRALSASQLSALQTGRIAQFCETSQVCNIGNGAFEVWIFHKTFLNEHYFRAKRGCIMHILKTNFNGNPNVGLFGFATDEYCLLGKEIKKYVAKEIEKVLKVPVHQITLAGTSLIGAFAVGNSKILLSLPMRSS